MKTNSIQLHKDPSDVILLLNGYLFYGKCAERLQKSEIDATKFYSNGLKLCRKYLPNNHFLVFRFTH